MMDKKAFKETILLVIELAGENGIGAVKLNKCLIMIDALHNMFYKESLTNATYIKHKYGPIFGEEAHELLDKMIASRDIEVFDEMVSPGMYEKTHYLRPGVTAPKQSFSNEEIDMISWVVSNVLSIPTQELSKITHNGSYHKTQMFHEINLDDICSWKISKETSNCKNPNRIKELLEENLNELNTFV